MIILKITDWKEEKFFFIRNLFNFSRTKKINNTGQLRVSFSVFVNGLENFEIKKGYKIQAFLQNTSKKTKCIFSGYIHELEIANNQIRLFCYDIISYLKYRVLRENKSFNNTEVKNIISSIFSYLKSISPLPMQLGKNDVKDKVSITLQVGMSFFEILKELQKKVNGLNFKYKIQEDFFNNNFTNILEVSKNIGKNIEGVWVDNAQIQQRFSKVLNRSRKNSFDDFCNYRMDDKNNIVTNQESIEESGLFEKREKNPEGQPDVLDIYGTGLPKIALDLNKEEVAEIDVGDKKQIRLISKVSRIQFEYFGIIQEIQMQNTSAGGFNYTIKIGEKIEKESNILDKTLEKYKKDLKK